MKKTDYKTTKEIVNGEGFYYLGKIYKLKLSTNSAKALEFKDEFLLKKDCVIKAKNLLINWYKKRAYAKIKERCELYSKKTGLQYSKINITNAQKRWGSCNKNNKLNFSWRLVMAPLLVIDYVVIHELVHTEEKNHSKKFWKKIRTIMPDYERQKKWLVENGKTLTI